MNGAISAILVGILKSIGWEKLVLHVFEDMFYLAAKKVGVEAVSSICVRLGDACKEVDQKGK